MGFASLYEDVRDRWYDNKPVTISPAPVKREPAYACPLCQFRSDSFRGIEHHIFEAHRQFLAYVRVNDVVVTDSFHCPTAIEDIVLRYLADGRSAAQLIIDDELAAQKQLVAEESWDLREYLPRRTQSQSSMHRITVAISRGALPVKTFRISYGARPQDLRVPQMDDLVDALMQPFLEGDVPDWDKLARLVNGEAWSDIECRYLTGAYDYAWGLCLDEQQDDQALRHFERAFSSLAYFQAGAAEAITRALSLRMNWFAELRRCPEKSQFAGAARFLGDGATLPSADPLTRRGSQVRVSTSKPVRLAVPDLQKGIMEAINKFEGGEWQAAHEMVESYRHRRPLIDVMDDTKLTLLEARCLKAAGDLKGAAGRYSLLRGHPSFGPEAAAHA